MSNVDHVADQMYARAVAAVKNAGSTTVAELQGSCRLSYSGAVEFLARMESEAIVGAPDEQGRRALAQPA